MRRPLPELLWPLLWLLLTLAPAALAQQQPDPPGLLALSYHDVMVDPEAALRDPAAVALDQLVAQFAWLEAHGYTPVSLDHWLAGEALPQRPVLLTFDDGYASFYEHVLPLLRRFDFPAVLAPVTAWIDTPAGTPVRYGSELAPRERFLSWPQLAEIAASGLVEIASHSHDLHRGVIGNPFGNLQPAAVTRRYRDGRYEAEADYRGRVAADLAISRRRLQQELAVEARTLVWPYGRYNATAERLAQDAGFAVTLTLGEGVTAPGSRRIHRKLLGSDMDLADFVRHVQDLYPEAPLRAAHVDLDYVYDPDPAQQARNLDALLDRIKAMGLSAVFLQAFADPDGDGVASALYYPNRHLPVRADLFNRVAWQLRTRAGVAVYAWMPVLAFELPDDERNRRLAVRTARGPAPERYHRLSPYAEEARGLIGELYADLGRHAHFDGVLFHDDAFLDADEDHHPQALAHYARTSDEGTLASGADKSGHLTAFTLELAAVLREEQPALRTARNLYAPVVLDPASTEWFAQHYGEALENYDYTAVMAMPYLEEVRRPRRWLARLAAEVAAHPEGLERTLFHVQTVDWRHQRPLSARTLRGQLRTLLEAGARHIAYYPDDFVTAHPPVPLVRSLLSVNAYPAVED